MTLEEKYPIGSMWSTPGRRSDRFLVQEVLPYTLIIFHFGLKIVQQVDPAWIVGYQLDETSQVESILKRYEV